MWEDIMECCQSFCISDTFTRHQEQGAILKASHELREAGQNHRFKDEIEYILEGVRSRDRLSVRRAR
jgi:hypothetical protein